MSFSALYGAAERLLTTLRTATGRDLIAQVSLERPSDEATEISFHKSVMWGYAFWVEACQPAGHHLLNIVRNTSPSDHNLVSRAFTDVQKLRATKAHNLDPTSKSDQHKLTQARIWMVENGGEPTDWAACTKSLCGTLAAALNILTKKWEFITSSSEDANIGVEQLLLTVDREWPAHLFDRMVEEAAAKKSRSGRLPEEPPNRLASNNGIVL